MFTVLPQEVECFWVVQIDGLTHINHHKLTLNAARRSRAGIKEGVGVWGMKNVTASQKGGDERGKCQHKDKMDAG
jgi:hypothetical protein